jgi:hypothetical protein
LTSVQDAFTRVELCSGLSWFRLEFYDALAARADGLFELVDAMLCADGPVKSLVELSLAPEHRRGHGTLYDALNSGRVDLARLRVAIGAAPVPRAGGGRIVLAVTSRTGCAWTPPPARSGCSATSTGAGDPRTSSFPAGRTRSSPPWSPAAPRGPRCWTRSGSAPPTMSPR